MPIAFKNSSPETPVPDQMSSIAKDMKDQQAHGGFGEAMTWGQVEHPHSGLSTKPGVKPILTPKPTPNPNAGKIMSPIKKEVHVPKGKQMILEPEKDEKPSQVEPQMEVSPPGWSGTTKAMKKHKKITNPFALAWWMKKHGAHPHYKPEEKEVKEDEFGMPI